jgi:ribosomal protein S15P/S13E
MKTEGTISPDDYQFYLLTDSIDEMTAHLKKNAIGKFKLTVA